MYVRVCDESGYVFFLCVSFLVNVDNTIKLDKFSRSRWIDHDNFHAKKACGKMPPVSLVVSPIRFRSFVLRLFR